MRVLLVLATAIGVAGCVTEAGNFGQSSTRVAAGGPTTHPTPDELDDALAARS